MLKTSGVDTSRLLVEAMKVAQVNHKYLANNIANVDTPHYNPVHLDFKKTLQASLDGRGSLPLRRSHAKHIDFERHHGRLERLAITSKNDFNKVDLDDQLMRLSKNRGQYTTYASILSKKFAMAKSMLQSLSR